MSGTATVTVRLDADLKREAAGVAEAYGLDLSTATRLFYMQMARTNTVPVSLDYERPSATSLEAIAQAREIAANGGPSFDTVEDMWKAMGV